LPTAEREPWRALRKNSKGKIINIKAKDPLGREITIRSQKMKPYWRQQQQAAYFVKEKEKNPCIKPSKLRDPDKIIWMPP